MITLLCAISILANTAIAETSCKDVITACDNAIAKKDQELQLSDLALKSCTSANSEYIKENTDLQDKANKWYRNPFVMFILGAAAGTTTYVLLHNK